MIEKLGQGRRADKPVREWTICLSQLQVREAAEPTALVAWTGLRFSNLGHIRRKDHND